MTLFLKRMVKLLIRRNDCGLMKSSHIKNIQNPRIIIHFTIIHYLSIDITNMLTEASKLMLDIKYALLGCELHALDVVGRL